MPFLTRIRSGGGEASYTPASTETTHNAIIANYGASQGFDNDDGSSASVQRLFAPTLPSDFHCASALQAGTTLMTIGTGMLQVSR